MLNKLLSAMIQISMSIHKVFIYEPVALQSTTYMTSNASFRVYRLSTDVHLCVIFIFISQQLAQLMADLQKMTGGVGVLKKQSGRQTTKRKSPVSMIENGYLFLYHMKLTE